LQILPVYADTQIHFPHISESSLYL